MLLKADNLVKIYKGRRVVNDLSFVVEQGEIVGLLGPNGAGKTTCFYMVVGLIKPDMGKVLVERSDLTPLARYKRDELGIGYLGPEAAVVRKPAVEENILAVLETTNLPKKEQKEGMERLLEEISLTHGPKNLGVVLSGGE